MPRGNFESRGTAAGGHCPAQQFTALCLLLPQIAAHRPRAASPTTSIRGERPPEVVVPGWRLVPLANKVKGPRWRVEYLTSPLRDGEAADPCWCDRAATATARSCFPHRYCPAAAILLLITWRCRCCCLIPASRLFPLSSYRSNTMRETSGLRLRVACHLKLLARCSSAMSAPHTLFPEDRTVSLLSWLRRLLPDGCSRSPAINSSYCIHPLHSSLCLSRSHERGCSSCYPCASLPALLCGVVATRANNDNNHRISD